MKREHHHLHPRPEPPSMAASSNGGSAACGGGYLNTGKAKMWEEEAQLDGGMDELLAVLGYKVKSSNMAEVAQKIEQLEEVMGQVQDNGLPHIDFESTVHYNPSDIGTWLESMLSELHPPPNFEPVLAAPPPSQLDDSSFLAPAESSTITSIDYDLQRQNSSRIFEESSSSDYDLKAIPSRAIGAYSPRDNKRLKSSSESDSDLFSTSPIGALPAAATDSVTRPVVLVDSQENGIQLVHALMACAEAVQQSNLSLAEALVKRIGYLANSQAGAMRKVATFFAEALARRIYRLCPEVPLEHSMADMLQMHFYESCPYLKFAHFTANQAILEAFEGKKRVHVIDFSMNQGMQWPALLQALALRPSGPPAFRLTGIGPPASDNSDYLQEVGWKLARLAETIHVEFEYRGFVASSLADLDASMLELRPSEVESVVVNSVFELHKLLARPGAIEKVLSVVKQMKPEIMTVVEQEANHNGPVFMDRFTESLHYYSTLFDSLEGSGNNQDKMMSEMYLGKQICNVVACEGVDRVERHETLSQWRSRLSSAGFEAVHLGSNAFKQASMLLALFGSGEGYRVEENDGSLTLGWHTRPLIATSAWKLGNNPVVAH